MTETASKLTLRRISTPTQIATGIAAQAGNTDVGKITISVAMMVLKTGIHQHQQQEDNHHE
jgi:hypothetical protein